jgi:hypothetical protein
MSRPRSAEAWRLAFLDAYHLVRLLYELAYEAHPDEPIERRGALKAIGEELREAVKILRPDAGPGAIRAARERAQAALVQLHELKWSSELRRLVDLACTRAGMIRPSKASSDRPPKWR